jgi:methyl coenzyme M reductase subunit D
MLVQVFGAEIRLEVEPGDFLIRVGAKNDGGTKTKKNQLDSWLARMLSLEYDVFCTHIVFL